MDGLLSFILFAALFYLMMRFGCGAHMVHGHHGTHDDNHDSNNESGGIDPVCGNRVHANEGYSKAVSEGRFYFCSKDCLDQFERDPKHYIAGYPMLVKSAATHKHENPIQQGKHGGQ